MANPGSGYLDFAEDAWDWFDNSDLRHWLLHDTWPPSRALPLICNIDPTKSVSTISRSEIIDFVDVQPDANNIVPFWTHIALLSEDPRICLEPCADPGDTELGYATQELSEERITIDLFDLMARMYRRYEAYDQLKRVTEIFFSNPQHVESPVAAPSFYLEWAQTKSINIPWLDWARKRQLLPDPIVKEKGTLTQDKGVHSREKNNLLWLILALCEAQDIDHTQRGIAQKIVGFVETSGGSISDDTVRKILHQIKNLR